MSINAITFPALSSELLYKFTSQFFVLISCANHQSVADSSFVFLFFIVHMSFADIVGGPSDTFPSTPPSNRDVIRFFFHHHTKQKRVAESCRNVAHLIFDHSITLSIYSETDLQNPSQISR